jgi:hypothetical protein
MRSENVAKADIFRLPALSIAATIYSCLRTVMKR